MSQNGNELWRDELPAFERIHAGLQKADQLTQRLGTGRPLEPLPEPLPANHRQLSAFDRIGLGLKHSHRAG